MRSGIRLRFSSLINADRARLADVNTLALNGPEDLDQVQRNVGHRARSALSGTRARRTRPALTLEDRAAHRDLPNDLVEALRVTRHLPHAEARYVIIVCKVLDPLELVRDVRCKGTEIE